ATVDCATSTPSFSSSRLPARMRFSVKTEPAGYGSEFHAQKRGSGGNLLRADRILSGDQVVLDWPHRDRPTSWRPTFRLATTSRPTRKSSSSAQSRGGWCRSNKKQRRPPPPRRLSRSTARLWI